MACLIVNHIIHILGIKEEHGVLLTLIPPIMECVVVLMLLKTKHRKRRPLQVYIIGIYHFYNLLLHAFMNKTLKRYIISSVITFLTAFLGSLVALMEQAQGWGDLSLKAVLMASLFTGIRVLIKYLYELLPR